LLRNGAAKSRWSGSFTGVCSLSNWSLGVLTRPMVPGERRAYCWEGGLSSGPGPAGVDPAVVVY
jgi:hypothetical protein